jgi:hypothetical protein
MEDSQEVLVRVEMSLSFSLHKQAANLITNKSNKKCTVIKARNGKDMQTLVLKLIDMK